MFQTIPKDPTDHDETSTVRKEKKEKITLSLPSATVGFLSSTSAKCKPTHHPQNFHLDASKYKTNIGLQHSETHSKTHYILRRVHLKSTPQIQCKI